MVNLATGDFTYNLPLIEVPGPEGGFSLPLSYHSGIGLEDEASWAGLGWNVNVGAINRSKVGTLDDAKDELTQVHVADPGGSAYVKDYGFYQKSWDSNKGFGGAVNFMNIFGYTWSGSTSPLHALSLVPLTKPRNLTSGSIMGLNFNKDHAKFNPTQFAQGAMAVGTIVATAGTAPALNGAPAYAKAINMGMSAAMTTAQVMSARNTGSTTYGQIGEFVTSKTPGKRRVDYKYWLDATRTEHGYGALYLGQMKNTSVVPPPITTDKTSVPRIGVPGNYINATQFKQSAFLPSGNDAVISDMHMYVEPGAEYAWTFNPTSIAYDSYSVMGPGISGSMAPYRPDVGTLVYPKKMSQATVKFNLFPFLEEGNTIDKIQFKFEGELSNTYRYHDSSGPGLTQSYSAADKRIYYQVQDPKLNVPAQRTEANRDGLYTKKLAQARQVEWFTNAEMASGVPQSQGKVMAYNTTSEIVFSGYNYEPSKIGAYAITGPDGTTYHYSLPVYNKEEYYFTGVTGQEGSKYAESTNSNAYATSWLLTAITGPDFVDRGLSGVVDKDDLGYWVKFEYGRLTSSYKWRFPYVGYTQENGTSSFSKGLREAYYLNSIKTRTHTALFFKDIRKDGRASYRRSSTGSLPGMNPTDDEHPASSLLLREVALLNNADYDQLVSQGFGIASAAGTAAEAAYLNAPQGTSSVTCSLSGLFDVYDIAQNPAFRTFLDQKAERRVVLNTSYQLCPGTYNSFASAVSPPNLNGSNVSVNRLGKLTLNSVSCFGPNNVRLFPDFKFQYNSPNPAYNPSAWDGWGAYNVNGSQSHIAAASDPTSWHLTDIVTPLGGRVSVTYESDDYGSISGMPIKQRIPITGFTFNGYDATHGFISFNTSNIAPYGLNTILANGTQITIKDLTAKQEGRCWDAGGGWQRERDYDIPSIQTVSGVTNGGFVIQRSNTYTGHGNLINGCGRCEWTKISGYIEVEMPKKKGGNIRVASLSAKDGANHEYKTAYRYTTDGTTQGASSGVIAQEPAFISTVDYDFYHLFDFPNTSVLYSKVSVLDGMAADGTYAGKTEYAFTTPRADMVQVSNPVSETLNLPSNFGDFNSWIKNSKRWYYEVASHTAQIGRVESIKVFDGSGNKMSNSAFEYGEILPGDQGIFTSGSILSEYEREGTCGTSCPPSYFKFIRTNKTYYPNVLKNIHTTANGVSSWQQNLAWDFLTGEVNESISEDALGTQYKTATVPAYAKYSTMRSKAENGANKHMLSQTAQTYTYKLNNSNTITDVIAASAQTWSNSWTRRAVNSAGQFDNTSALAPIWRVKSSYIWHPRALSSSGTTPLGNFTDYNWSSSTTQHTNWEKRGEMTRFDDYTANLESYDGTGTNASVVKYGHSQSQVLVRATNARYGEIAYSGAEDGATTASYFGGEVSGAALYSSDVSHTGRNCLKLTNTGQKGFEFTTPVTATEGVEAGRTYRMAAWLYNPTAQRGQLFASVVDGSTVTTITTASAGTVPTKRAGDWVLVEGVFTVPASALNKRLNVGCENTGGGPVYFDDFRFAPLDASSVAYVYDPQSWNVTHQLNNDNFYTQYEYDGRGQVAKTYLETLSDATPRKLVAEQAYNYARDMHYTITTTVGTGSGSIVPLGASNVYVDDDLGIDATGSSCSWTLASNFKINGTPYWGSAALPDGTQVQVNNGTLSVRNVHGNYTIEVNFADQEYYPEGTWYESHCESNGPCYSGNSIWRLADGCGGYTSEEARPSLDLYCGPGPCPQNRK